MPTTSEQLRLLVLSGLTPAQAQEKLLEQHDPEKSRFFCQCGWAFYYTIPGKAKCPQCQATVILPLPRELAQVEEVVERAQICEGCHFLTGKGCAHYLRPCTVKQLWKDQIDPPELCPRKDKFY